MSMCCKLEPSWSSCPLFRFAGLGSQLEGPWRTVLIHISWPEALVIGDHAYLEMIPLLNIWKCTYDCVCHWHYSKSSVVYLIWAWFWVSIVRFYEINHIHLQSSALLSCEEAHQLFLQEAAQVLHSQISSLKRHTGATIARAILKE